MPLQVPAFSSFQPASGEAAPISSSVVAGLSYPCCLDSDLGPGWAEFLRAHYPASNISQDTSIEKDDAHHRCVSSGTDETRQSLTDMGVEFARDHYRADQL